MVFWIFSRLADSLGAVGEKLQVGEERRVPDLEAVPQRGFGLECSSLGRAESCPGGAGLWLLLLSWMATEPQGPAEPPGLLGDSPSVPWELRGIYSWNSFSG